MTTDKDKAANDDKSKLAKIALGKKTPATGAKDAKDGDASGNSDPKSKWGKAVIGVRAFEKKAKPDTDPFLDRFTVTGRSFSAENEPAVYIFRDFFTKHFWLTVIVDPSGSTYNQWSMVVMLGVLFNLMLLPVRVMFDEPQKSFLYICMIFDYIADIIYLIDMFYSSRLAFLEQGLLVRDAPRLAKTYIKSWKFKVDIVSILPTDVFYTVVGYGAYLRFNRLLKIWRFKEYFHMAEAHTNFPNLIRVSNLILYIIIIIHWFGCFYYGLSYLIGFGTDEWVYPDPTLPGNDDFWKQYSHSFYWSTLTLTTIGDTEYPITPIETWFCVGCSLVGVLIFATIFGNVGAMINHMDAARTEHQNKVDNVKNYMELRGIQPDLQSRVIKWFDYTWNNKESVDDKDALQFLPEKLKAEISIHVHIGTLRRVNLFKDCEPGLLVELVLKLTLQVYSPGDFICRKGDIGKEMYIIKRGKLQVVSEDGKKVFVTLTDGAVFGEISVLNIAGNKTGNRRTASVKTVGYSDLFCLTKNDLWQALEEYPDAKKMLLEKGKQVLRKDNLLDEEAAMKEEKRQQAMVSKVEMIVDAVDDVQKSIDRLHEKLEKFQGSSSLKSTKSLRSLTNLADTGKVVSLPPVEKTDSRKTPTIPEEDEKPAVAESSAKKVEVKAKEEKENKDGQ